MKPGDCLDIWEGDAVRAVGLLGEEKGRLRVATPQGREMRIPDNRVVNCHATGLDPKASPDALARALRAREDELGRRAAAVDLASLWEVVVDAGGGYGLDELAELALGSRDGDARAVMLRALVGDSLRFVRRRSEFVPRTRAELDETLKRRSAEEERTRRREEFVAAGRAFLGGGAPPPFAVPRGGERFVEALRDLAVRGLDSDRIREAMGLLEDLGFAGRGEPPHAAFEALVRFGVFGRDENLLLHRYGVRRDFPREVLEEAEELARAPLGEDPGRRDLRRIETFAIDDPETTEVDDAISIEDLGDGRARFGVHIAEPASRIPFGSRVDREARERATTYYLPEERILMLPPVLSERAASLVAGADRPALSFLVELDREGRELGHEIALTLIHISRRISYADADRAIAAGGGAPGLHEPWDAEVGGGEPPAPPAGFDLELCRRLARGARLARALAARRAEAGALLLKGPDLDVKVRDGRIEIERFEPWTPAWVLVSEAMILANALAARWFVANDAPAIFRRQAPPDQPIVLPPGGHDPAAVAQARRLIKRTELGLTPAPHSGLGLAAYVQISSPLRRYQDFACQRNLRAALLGQAPPFGREALWAVAQAADETEKQAREIERDRRTYWLYRYFESLPPDAVLEARVTRPEERRTFVELTDYVHVATLMPRSGHKPGRALKVAIDAVNPRAGRLVLREVG